MSPANKSALITSMLVVPWLVSGLFAVLFVFERNDNEDLRAKIVTLENEKQKITASEAEYKGMLGRLIDAWKPTQVVNHWLPPLSPNTTGGALLAPLDAQLEFSTDATTR